MQIPRLGAESELQLRVYTPATATPDLSLICDLPYTTAHGNAGSLTHCTRPGIEPASAWILEGFITAEPQWELQLGFLS